MPATHIPAYAPDGVGQDIIPTYNTDDLTRSGHRIRILARPGPTTREHTMAFDDIDPVRRSQCNRMWMSRALRHSAKFGFGLALLAGIVGVSAAVHAEEDTFYKGKVLHVVVSSRAGGAYDLYARMLAKVLKDHIPGKPTVVVQNMPGAGGVKATNYMYALAPRDGTVIAATHSGIETAPLRFPKVAKFDLNEFSHSVL